MEKHIKRLRLDHAHNVRDLGGFETADGGMVRWNTLYRAGNLSEADSADWERLKAAGVRSILDLRSLSEIRSFPDRAPEGISWQHTPLQTEEIDMNDLAGSAGKAFQKSLKEGYLNMVGQHTHLLASALARLTECLEQGAVLFHCSAGKDRTGIIASSVLYLCGVDREDIIADYEVSYTYNQNGLNASAGRMPGFKEILPLLQSDRENMEQLLYFYGEMDLAARLAENGFSLEAQQRLRELTVV